MANQTLVSVPTQFSELSQVRAFVVKLVEKLDLVLGYRGQTGYISTEDASKLVSVTLTSLSNDLSVLTAFVAQLQDSINSVDGAYTSGVSISDFTYVVPTISGTFVQAEVQAIATNLGSLATTLNSLLAALRTVYIIQ